jgi:hypothetical protein
MDEQNEQLNIPQENLPTLETYSSDMAEAVRENEASVIKIALAEKAQEEREVLYKKAEGTGTQKLFLVLGGIILIVGAIIGSYILIQKNQQRNTVSEQAVVKNPSTPISYDTYTYLDATNAATVFDLADLIKAPLSASEKPQSIKSLFLTKTVTLDQKTGPVSVPLSIQQLVSILGLKAPAALLGTFNAQYMIGAYQDTDKPYPFLIFTVKDYSQAYASMLQWEHTMLNDLYPILGIDVSGDRSGLLTKQFKDILINNKDARVLYDDTGKEVLYYIFINKNEFAISGNSNAIKEIISRSLIANTQTQ